MATMRVLIWWDTEDFINPESDEALLLLLKEHKKRNIPAVFKMVGEKSRVLKRRGRTDIIDLLSDPLFDIGYHTNFHSVHPTIGEYTVKGPRFIPADMVRTYGKTVGPWRIHRPDFRGENLRRLTQLIAWSFKPAVLLG